MSTLLAAAISVVLSTYIICQPANFDKMLDKYVSFPAEGELRFAVALQPKKSSIPTCSGVILHDFWVLTSANCVTDNASNTLPNDGLFVLAGSVQYDLASTKTKKNSTQIAVHPSFRHGVFSKFDLAVIKVDSPFPFGKTIGMIKLSNETWDVRKYASKNCYSYGFGNKWYKNLTKALKVWKTTGLHGEGSCPCTKSFQRKRLVCVKEAVGVNLCRGDLGSALVCYKGKKTYPDSNTTKGSPKQMMKLDNRDVAVYGIAHMTLDKHMCQIARIPDQRCAKIPTITTYMYVCPFNDWISSYVPGQPDTPFSCAAEKLVYSIIIVFFVQTLLLL